MTKKPRKLKRLELGQDFKDMQALIEVLRGWLNDPVWASSPAGRAAARLAKHDNISPKQG